MSEVDSFASQLVVNSVYFGSFSSGLTGCIPGSIWKALIMFTYSLPFIK